MSIELHGRTYTHKDERGRLVRILGTDRGGKGASPVVGCYMSKDATELDEGVTCWEWDQLTPLPVKKSGFINLYREDGMIVSGGKVFDTESEAKGNRKPLFTGKTCLGTVPVSWEETPAH